MGTAIVPACSPPKGPYPTTLSKWLPTWSRPLNIRIRHHGGPGQQVNLSLLEFSLVWSFQPSVLESIWWMILQLGFPESIIVFHPNEDLKEWAVVLQPRFSDGGEDRLLQGAVDRQGKFLPHLPLIRHFPDESRGLWVAAVLGWVASSNFEEYMRRVRPKLCQYKVTTGYKPKQHRSDSDKKILQHTRTAPKWVIRQDSTPFEGVEKSWSTKQAKMVHHSTHLRRMFQSHLVDLFWGKARHPREFEGCYPFS